MSKYNTQVVSDAITMLDAYASQRSWSGRMRHEHITMTHVSRDLGVDKAAYDLGAHAWERGQINKDLDFYQTAAEGAQLLREGWRP